MKKLTALLLALALLLCGCGSVSGQSTDLMAGKPIRMLHLADIPEGSSPSTDFALALFRASLEQEENTLISPLSVLLALGMTANGAEGDTLAQMEATLGMALSDLNDYLYYLMDEPRDGLKLANALWFRDQGLDVRDTFLNTVSTYYRGAAYQAPMDESTVNAINSWVKENTDGMIPEILSQLDANTVMCLVNALAFEAQWEEVYQEHQIGTESTFYTASGQPKTVEFMISKEYAYLEDENAIGFVKYYEGRDYAFAALLPNEDVALEDYVNSLTGEQLQSLLSHPQQVSTRVSIPKFETAYMGDLSKTLESLGMADAFDWQLADFSRMGTAEGGNIYISQVLHRTYISVAEQGTKAGAATAVIMAEGAMAPEDYKTVTLNRPFLYLIWDVHENVPLFIGTLLDPT